MMANARYTNDLKFYVFDGGDDGDGGFDLPTLGFSFDETLPNHSVAFCSCHQCSMALGRFTSRG